MYLKVSQIHSIYIEQVGNIEGFPIFFVHGGPGAGFCEDDKKFFDLNKYRVIFFDQRGAGKSLPMGELEENNTSELIDDIERIRIHFGLEKMTLFGGSWGTTLSLLYAIRYPNRVSGMILRGVFLGTKKELDWFISEDGVANFFPESYYIFSNFFQKKLGIKMINEYYKNLNGKNSYEYAKIWNNYESSLMRLEWNKNNKLDNNVNLSLVKLEVYYFLNKLFISENYILKNIKKIENINTVIIQGRYDIVCPPLYARKLHKKMKKSTIDFILGGHSPYEKNMFEKLREAMDKAII